MKDRNSETDNSGLDRNKCAVTRAMGYLGKAYTGTNSIPETVCGNDDCFVKRAALIRRSEDRMYVRTSGGACELNPPQKDLLRVHLSAETTKGRGSKARQRRKI